VRDESIMVGFFKGQRWFDLAISLGYKGVVRQVIKMNIVGVRVELPTNQPIVLLQEEEESASFPYGSARSRRLRSLSPSRASRRRDR